MVFRPTTDQQILDLQNAESARGLCRAEKKEDKINKDGPIVDLQIINLFLSTCGQDASIKLRSPMSLMKLIDTPYKEIRSAIQN